MNTERDPDRYDLARMIAASLYQGILINILLPAGLLMVAYFLDQRGAVSNSVGGFANTLFYVLAVVTLAEGVVALLWRQKTLHQPMIHRRETFEEDIREGLKDRLRPIFLLIAAMALNGFIYYLLTGRFKEAMAFVLLSFVSFQIVRPRYGMLRTVVKTQEELVSRGQFMNR